MQALRPNFSPELIDGVAAATLHRDRAQIELSLVELVQQFVEAQSVTLFRLQRENGQEHAVPCTTALPASGGVAIDRKACTPRLLADLPEWRLCIEHLFPKTNALNNGALETVFPVAGDSGTAVGMLQIIGPRGLDPRELYVVGGILQIVRNHMALIDYGERDTLTGLLNRKTFETQFEKLRGKRTQEAGAMERACWIGLVDIDHFKSINDRFGHVFGDEVLLLVSQIMQRTFRSADHIYRFGGEEFVILLQETTEEITGAAFERLRAAIERHAFPQLGQVTVSLGWTRIRPHDAPTNAIERADAALYHAKRAGRNSVCHYDALLASGVLTGGSMKAQPEIELF
jgi:diguanylate cyclase (GGDEF)-like protein